MTQCIQTAEEHREGPPWVPGKQRAFRKYQGWAGPLGTLGHFEAPESSMEPVQGSPSCSATEADLVGRVRLACRASGVRSCAVSV